MDYILKWDLSFSLSDKEKLSEDEYKWNAVLSGYGISHIDELDIAISKVIKCGYLEETGFCEEVEKLNVLYDVNDLKKSYVGVWEKYFHNSFAGNQDKFIEESISKFREAILYLPPLDLNGLVKILRQLDEDSKADELIDEYILKRTTDNVFNLDTLDFSRPVDDPTILGRFKIHLGEICQKKSLEKIFEDIESRHTWEPEDEQVFIDATQDDYFKLFMNYSGDHLYKVVNACIEFGQVHGEQKVGKKVKDALRQIAEISRFHALRVRKFGVDIE